eukprot:Nitzschia sp. Nitz4//scaffold15_size197535//132603//134631//NITZ4_001593-RA/size197535-augustus-gene-0.228-mRNA-1//-1//CDS//3329537760//3773//frame0
MTKVWLTVVGLLLSMSRVDASITVVDLDKVFGSRPENKVGRTLWKGYDYMGRLQYLPNNLQLCPSSSDPDATFDITPPSDGVPVALYADYGGCTLEEKARVATSLIRPVNAVGYLIVGHRKVSWTDEASLSDEDWLPETVTASDMDTSSVKLDMETTSTAPKTVPLRTLLPEKHALAEGITDDESVTHQSLPEPVNPVPTETMETLESFYNSPESGLAADDDDDSTDEDFSHSRAVPLLQTDDSNTDEQVGPLPDVEPEVVLGPPQPVPAATPVVEGETPDVASDDESVAVPLEHFRVKRSNSSYWVSDDTTTFVEEDDQVAEDERRNLAEINGFNIAILHVNAHVAKSLVSILSQESAETEKLGGYKVVLNSRGAATLSTIFAWTTLTLCFSFFLCGCMCFYIGQIPTDDAAPQQPVRHRLTYAQVRQRFPAFQYRAADHVEEPLDEECVICLDDFEEDTRLRKLPCGHVFHSTCISRWLVERSAVCPLCKYDLYEPEETESVPSSAAVEPTPSSSWSTVFRQWFPGESSTTATGNSSPWYASWWSSTSEQTPIDTPRTGPTPPPSAFSNFQEASGNDTNTTTPPTEPIDTANRALPNRFFGWRLFGRRAGTRGMQTELTEPLISTSDPTSELPAETPASEAVDELPSTV